MPEMVDDKETDEDDFLKILDWLDIWIALLDAKGMFCVKFSVSGRQVFSFCRIYTYRMYIGVSRILINTKRANIVTLVNCLYRVYQKKLNKFEIALNVSGSKYEVFY